MKFCWISVNAIVHKRNQGVRSFTMQPVQVCRGVILVDVEKFETALEQATAAGLIHAEDLVMGYEVELEDLPENEAAMITRLPRLELLTLDRLKLAGLKPIDK